MEEEIEFNDDAVAWEYLKKRGYECNRGIIKFRPEKEDNMPINESNAIDYLVYEWDYSYE